MRFRYFDESGAEVEVSSVEALAFRISTGAVQPDTLLYDAAVDDWRPAEEHAVYAFALEEGRPVGSGSPDRDAPDRDARERDGQEKAHPEADPGGGAPSAPSPRVTPTADVGATPEVGSSPDDASWADGASRPDDTPRTEGADPEPAPETIPVTWPDTGSEAGAGDGTSGAPAPDRSREPEAAPEGAVPAASRSREGVGRAVSTGQTPSGPARRAAPSGVRRSRSGLGRRLRRLLVGTGTAALVVLAGVVTLAAAGDPGPAEPESAGEMAVAGPTDPVPTPTEGAEAPETTPEPAPDEARLASLTADVTAAATGDLAVALLDLQEALEVPESPPEAWLEGAYFADAGSHPRVRRYWERFGNSVSVTRALEDQLFRGFVKDHVARMGLERNEADLLSARVLARFASASEKREVLYDDLATLAREAGELHELLARRSADISYEPFREGTLSRDPVVEAVPDDPELAEEVWGHVDRIFDILERIQGIGPVTTEGLQDALLQGIRPPSESQAP